MNILIAGGSGFLGSELTKFFTDRDHLVKILTRNPHNKNQIKWDGKTKGDWVKEIDNTDVIINMAGKSVDCRYTELNKSQILNSRIHSTSILNEAVSEVSKKPFLWINSSSATTYIHSETTLMTEKNGIIGNDFSMTVCKKWEEEFFSKEIEGVRKVATRTSIVLGNEGGAFPKMKAITKLGLGGKQGNGQQKMSWIHINDFCRAIEFLINSKNVSGPVNITSPNPISNNQFMSHLRSSLNIPIGINQPKFLLEIGAFLLRTETELLLKSRNVYPEILINSGFEFNFKEAKKALNDLIF
ncbi:MAG: TIGR01777 family oxidoreductase [Balneola sp.]